MLKIIVLCNKGMNLGVFPYRLKKNWLIFFLPVEVKICIFIEVNLFSCDFFHYIMEFFKGYKEFFKGLKVKRLDTPWYCLTVVWEEKSKPDKLVPSSPMSYMTTQLLVWMPCLCLVCGFIQTGWGAKPECPAKCQG